MTRSARPGTWRSITTPIDTNPSSRLKNEGAAQRPLFFNPVPCSEHEHRFADGVADRKKRRCKRNANPCGMRQHGGAVRKVSTREGPVGRSGQKSRGLPELGFCSPSSSIARTAPRPIGRHFGHRKCRRPGRFASSLCQVNAGANPPPGAAGVAVRTCNFL